MFNGKSDDEVAKSGNVDSGWCNPMKIKYSNEAESDARNELMDRGYSYSEAQSMINDDD